MIKLTYILTFLFFFFHTLLFANGHILLRNPVPRGGLPGSRRRTWISQVIDSRAPEDEMIHFPAGVKSTDAGAGFQSQVNAAGSNPWAPFNPTSPNYMWRHGVCGDTRTKSTHLRGGIYYQDGRIVKTYTQGQQIDIETTVVFHHGGFLVFHLCDVSRCEGNEISEGCFKTPGACHILTRVPVSECDNNGGSDRCTPIDRNHPERWYLPCSKKQGVDHEIYGIGGTVKYQLPTDLRCDHCVLHQHYETADRCTPNDYAAYFNGPDAPGNGNGCNVRGFPVDGKRALFDPTSEECGQNGRYTEDYAHCSDISIEPGNLNVPNPTPPPMPSLNPPPPPPRQSAPKIDKVGFYAGGRFQLYLKRKTPCIYLKKGKSAYFKPATSGSVDRIAVQINGVYANSNNHQTRMLRNLQYPRGDGYMTLRVSVFNNISGKRDVATYGFYVL